MDSLPDKGNQGVRMEAKIQRHGDITVVSLSGRLDLEKNQNFRTVCLRKFLNQKTIFCLQDLQFVGSSGIQTFFRTLQEIHTLNKHGIKISGVKADFLRLLQYTAVSALEVHESTEVAVQSFVTGIPGGIQIVATPTDLSENDVSGEDSAEAEAGVVMAGSGGAATRNS